MKEGFIPRNGVDRLSVNEINITGCNFITSELIGNIVFDKLKSNRLKWEKE